MIFKVLKILAENGYRYYIEFSLSQRIRQHTTVTYQLFI